MSEPASNRVPQHQTPGGPGRGPGPRTALHRAAATGNSSAMAALVRGGCALDLQGRDGNTALHDASWHGFHQCVKLLVNAGADVHVKDKAGNTPLHLACQNAHAQSARVLLLGGSATDTKNKMGDTCLHVASRYDNVKVLELLLSALCSVTEKNQEGDTALHTAAALNHKRTVQLLLQAGAHGNVRNNAGRTALDRARDLNHAEATRLLARAPQVHHFMRGRTIRKQTERVKAERRTQSLTTVDTLAKKALNEERPGGGEGDAPETHRRKGLSRGPPETRAYPLYPLHRDRRGAGRQAPARRSHCRARFRRLEGRTRAVQEEMKSHIVSVQDQFTVQLGRLQRRNLHQIKALDMVHRERAAKEREAMLYRIDQHAEQAREEATRSRAAMSRELERRCVSRLRGTDLPPSPAPYALLQSPPGECLLQSPPGECLLQSPPGECSLAESNLLESTQPLLDLVSGDSSSSSLATSVSGHLPSLPSSSSSTTRANDDHAHQTPEGLSVSSANPCRRLPGVTLRGSVVPPATVGLGRARVASSTGGSSSSSSSSSSSFFAVPAKPGKAQTLATRGQRPGHRGHGGLCKRRLSEPSLARGRPTAGTHTHTDARLGFFSDRPTFIQERNNRHAVEVTGRFFEAVSAQLERWYQSKVQEARRQAELRAQQDTQGLMQRITALEEELRRLTANDEA